MSPQTMRKAREKASAMEGMYTVHCKAVEGGMGTTCSVTMNTPGSNHSHTPIMEERSEAQLELLKGIEMALEPVEVAFWSHDGPWQFVGHDYVSESAVRADLSEISAAGVCRVRRILSQRPVHPHRHDTPRLGICMCAAPALTGKVRHQHQAGPSQSMVDPSQVCARPQGLHGSVHQPYQRPTHWFPPRLWQRSKADCKHVPHVVNVQDDAAQ